ncbi:MAG: hypothetical protein JWP75_3669 [Frondihabitans sp.]|nr:hypothetical protein [Frondihabitans sp.]
MTPVSRELLVDDLRDLVEGLLLLGSGGGGDPRLLARATARQLALSPVTWVSLDELQPDDLVVPVGYIGSTAVLREKLPSGTELAEAVDALTRWTGRAPAALMTLEMAGLNGLSPIATASLVGLPLLDADLTGRALPRLDQSSLTASGRSIAPCVVTEPGGQTVLLDGISPTEVESLLRLIISKTSGWGALALAPQRVADLAETAIPGTADRALKLGRGLRSAPRNATARELSDAVDGRLIGSGRVVDLVTSPRSGGFDVTTVSILDESTGAVIRLEAENEFVIALVDGVAVTTAPDIIAVLGVPGASVLAVDDVHTGIEVAVVELAAPTWWTATPERRASVSPQAFGFDDYPAAVR